MKRIIESQGEAFSKLYQKCLTLNKKMLRPYAYSPTRRRGGDGNGFLRGNRMLPFATADRVKNFL